MNAPDCKCSPGRLPLGAFCAGRDDLEREAMHDDRISIHAPRAGCDRRQRGRSASGRRFQSTRPVWGATRSRGGAAVQGGHFNPRTPCGVRPQEETFAAQTLEFQSTHPVRGATAHGCVRGRRVVLFQSTHPVRGATQKSGAARADWNFNPRTPCGVRQQAAPGQARICDFNPRTPCGVRRYRAEYKSGILGDFNPRTPCGVRRYRAEYKSGILGDFNPRTPCGVRRNVCARPAFKVAFQSTHPVRGATPSLRQFGCSKTLFQSTHPVRGATWALRSPRSATTDFNPRTPCGVRPSAGRRRRLPSISIHAPRAGCDVHPHRRAARRDISIHAPRAGCDLRRAAICRARGISIHAPRAGCDLLPGAFNLNPYISIHAPRAGCDYKRLVRVCKWFYFNPRTPCGVRHYRNPYFSTPEDFNPRTPCGVRP